MHLVSRFFGTVFARRLTQAEAEWVNRHLDAGEAKVFFSQSVSDQQHGFAVAQRVVAILEDRATPNVRAAALLHDVGKQNVRFCGVRLGPIGRSLATVAWGLRLRFGVVNTYVQHNELGAELLRSVGADPFAATWALEHVWPEEVWTTPIELGRALQKADFSTGWNTRDIGIETEAEPEAVNETTNNYGKKVQPNER